MKPRSARRTSLQLHAMSFVVVMFLLIAVSGAPKPAHAACPTATQNQSTTHDTPFFPGQVPSCAWLQGGTGHTDSASCPFDAAGVYSGDSGGDMWVNFQAPPNDNLDNGTYTTYWSKNSGSKKCGSYVVRSAWTGGSCAPGGGAALYVSYGVDCPPACSPQQGQACQSQGNSCGMKNNGTVQCDGSCSASKPSDTLCPLGSHDASTCTSVYGWGFDPEYAGNMQVHIYQKPSGGALAFLAAFTANQSRPDVGAVYPGRTNSGWSFNPRLYPALMDGANHDIYAYAINVDSSGAGQTPNPLFGNSPKGLACTDLPTGTLTAACGSVSGTVNDAQGSPVTISIREQTTNAPSCQTDPLRAGPLPVGPVFGPIGIPAYTDGKKHTLIACARDVPSGQQPLQPFATAQSSCPPTVALTPGSSQVDFGTSTTIAWNVANVFNADGCTATPAGWFNPASITDGSGSGTATVGPLIADTTYSLTCTNEAGVAGNDSKTITVKVPPPEASVLDVRVPADGYCAGEPAMDIEWGYSSAARKISAYQVQVLRGGSVIYDSGKIARTALRAPDRSSRTSDGTGSMLWTRTSSLVASVFASLFTR